MSDTIRVGDTVPGQFDWATVTDVKSERVRATFGMTTVFTVTLDTGEVQQHDIHNLPEILR